MTPGARFEPTSAQALREEFDRSFSLAAPALPPPPHMLLAIRLAEAPYALRMDEIAGLFLDSPLTPLPSPLPELLGLTAFRGQAMPVYDLRALLGLPAGRPARWLVLTRLQPRVALAFDAFESGLAVPGGHLVDEVLDAGEAPRRVIGLGALVERIRRRVESINTSNKGSE